MSNESQMLLISTLKEMLNCCQKIHGLLKNDGHLFTNDQFESINNSNKMKIEWITKLSNLVSELTTAHPQGFMEQVKQSKDNSSETSELRLLANQLNNEVMHCYQYIRINSSVLSTNLQMLKNVWDKLIMLKSEDKLYDVSGHIVER